MEEASCQRKWWRKQVQVYHEKQSLLRQHCAVHTLNNVLQASVYTAKHFEDLAVSLQYGHLSAASSETGKPASSFCHAPDRGQNHSSDCTQGHGKTESAHLAAGQVTKLVDLKGRTAGEEAEENQGEDVLETQKGNMPQVYARQSRASRNWTPRVHCSADVQEQSCGCTTQQTQREGVSTAVSLTVSHPIAHCCQSETTTRSTLNRCNTQVHVKVDVIDHAQLLHSNCSDTGLSVNPMQLSCPHTASCDNHSCLSVANSSGKVKDTAYKSHDSRAIDGTTCPSTVRSEEKSDSRVFFCDPSSDVSWVLPGANTSSVRVCERNIIAAAEKGENSGNCGKQCVARLTERGCPLAADKGRTSSVITTNDYAAQGTNGSLPAATRDDGGHGIYAGFSEINQPVCGAGNRYSRATVAKANAGCDPTAAHPYESRGLISASTFPTGFPASHRRVSPCRAQACKPPACAANMTQPLKTLGGFFATASFPQTAADDSLHSSAPLPISTSEPGIPWRRRITSVLLGTDYSAPLGIGNYDLSLLQQLLCFHRLSLNFANTPGRIQAENDVQKCRFYSSMEDAEQRSARAENITREAVYLKCQREPVSHEEEQEAPLAKEQRGRHPQQQSQEDTVLPVKHSPPQRVKPHGNVSGWVTIEQLRNPRLLGFILNVRVPRMGWRRLLSVMGAERHFYTIRKIKCATATSANLASGERAKHVESAALPQEKSGFKPACEHVNDGGRGHSGICKEAEERENTVEISELNECTHQGILEKLPFATQPVCDSQVADAGHMKEEICSQLRSVEASKQDNTFHSLQGKYGIDFVWLDLDSNLSTPHIFQSEDALVIHLNRKLKEALREKAGSSRDQLKRNEKLDETLQVVPRRERSNMCTDDSEGVKCETSYCSVQDVDFEARAPTGLSDTSLSRCHVIEFTACGPPHIDCGAHNNLVHDRARERVLLDTQEACYRTHLQCDSKPNERKQYSNNVGTRSTRPEHQGCSSFPVRESGVPVPRQRETNGYPLCKRVLKGQGNIIVAKGPTGEHVEEEAADKAYSVADTPRERTTLDGVDNSELCDGAADGSEDEDLRGYKDLILIEVLQEEEAGQP